MRIELLQAVMPSPLLENKLLNIHRGISLINQSLIDSGESWSFWNRIGRPTARNGFVEGRNLVGDKLTRQIGGGLCQLSGLIYYLALKSGLDIIERHAHSMDIYREEERFTPLGADATVTWGVKDLRIRNPLPFAVSIACILEGTHLRAQLRCENAVQACDLAFVREDITPERVSVITVVDGVKQWQTDYIRRPNLDLPG